jgi:hypothetical protein
LIYYQEDKRSEEILYLFNQGEKARFSITERRNKRIYIFLIIFIPLVNLISLTIMLCNFLGNLTIYTASHILNAVLYIICLTSNLYFSAKLYKIMKKQHRYEFQRTFGSILYSVCVFTIYFYLSFFFEVYELIFDKNNSLDLMHLDEICSTPYGVLS